MPDSQAAHEIRHELRLLILATVCLYLVVIAAVVYTYIDSGNKRSALADEQARTTSALCALQGDLHARISGAKEYLAAHPNGLPALGVSASALRLQITAEESTLKALAPVDCGAA